MAFVLVILAVEKTDAGSRCTGFCADIFSRRDCCAGLFLVIERCTSQQKWRKK